MTAFDDDISYEQSMQTLEFGRWPDTGVILILGIPWLSVIAIVLINTL